jgi:hypothetical protein
VVVTTSGVGVGMGKVHAARVRLAREHRNLFQVSQSTLVAVRSALASLSFQPKRLEIRLGHS